MKYNLFIIIILISRFIVVLVQKQRCLFKDCECNDLESYVKEVFVECSDKDRLDAAKYFKLERNLRIAVDTGDFDLKMRPLNVSLTINLVKSKIFYIQDFVFQYLNFNVIKFRGNDFFDSSVVISSQAFSDVKILRKINFESIRNVYLREDYNPFKIIDQLPIEILFGNINLLQNRNFFKTLSAFQKSIRTVSLISSLDFIPDLRFLPQLFSLSITESTITNTTIYQINFDKQPFSILTDKKQFPINLASLVITSMYEIHVNKIFIDEIAALNNTLKRIFISDFNQTDFKTKINSNHPKQVSAYAKYLDDLKWDLVENRHEYEEGVKLTYSDYFVLNHNITDRILGTTVTPIIVLETSGLGSNDTIDTLDEYKSKQSTPIIE